MSGDSDVTQIVVSEMTSSGLNVCVPPGNPKGVRVFQDQGRTYLYYPVDCTVGQPDGSMVTVAAGFYRLVRPPESKKVFLIRLPSV